VTASSGRTLDWKEEAHMLDRPETVTTNTYVHLPNGTPIHVVRHEVEAEDDILSVRFGDEGLVLEIEEGLLPKLHEALRHARVVSAKAYG
jgi:hypothetical protein